MAKAKGVRREILISEEITNESVQKVIEKILDINHSDKQLEEDYGDKYDRKPIMLFINSFGGSCYDGLALVDTILLSKTPVWTVAIGSAMSMGLWIFMSGERRFVGRNATLMYHEAGYGVWGKIEEHKTELPEMERLQSLYDNIIKSNTKVTQSMLDDYKTRKAEWYIAPCDAVELGFADQLWK